MAGTTMQAG